MANGGSLRVAVLYNFIRAIKVIFDCAFSLCRVHFSVTQVASHLAPRIAFPKIVRALPVRSIFSPKTLLKNQDLALLVRAPRRLFFLGHLLQFFQKGAGLDGLKDQGSLGSQQGGCALNISGKFRI